MIFAGAIQHLIQMLHAGRGSVEMGGRFALVDRIRTGITEINFSLVISRQPKAERRILGCVRLQRILRRPHRHDVVECRRGDVFFIETLFIVPEPDERHGVLHVVAD